MSGKTDHVGVTTMERHGQGHLHPLLEKPETDMSRPGIKTQASAVGSKHYSKEPFEQRINSYFEHLQYMSPRQSEVMTPEEPSVRVT
jgi:hypothetical protein